MAGSQRRSPPSTCAASRARCTPPRRPRSPQERSPEMRVLIIADTAQAAEGIRRGLRHAPSCQVLGYTNGRVPCDATVAQAGPDVVVMDEMSDRDAVLARVREARGAAPSAKLVMLATDMDS